MGEEPELPSSTMYFENFNFRPFEADEMALSPPYYGSNPLTSARKTSFTKKVEKIAGGTARKDDASKADLKTPGRKFSHLMPAVYRSLENLALKSGDGSSEERGTNFFTRSLPPSAQSSPCSTPHGSPKPRPRHGAASEETTDSENNWNSQLWFYPGFLSSVIERNELSTFSADDEKIPSDSEHPQIIPSFPIGLSGVPRNPKTNKPKSSSFLSNRDMNFLAPTSM